MALNDPHYNVALLAGTTNNETSLLIAGHHERQHLKVVSSAIFYIFTSDGFLLISSAYTMDVRTVLQLSSKEMLLSVAAGEDSTCMMSQRTCYMLG